MRQNLTAGSIQRKLEFATQLRHVDRAQVTRTEGEVSRDVGQEISKVGLRNYFKQHVVEAVDLVGTVGIAHSYGLSPTVRRGLPALIDWKAIEHHRTDRNERLAAIHPKNGGSADRVCAIEVPFAACLELLAQRDLQPPACVVILGDTGDGIEATAVVVSREAATIRLSAEAYCSGTTDKVEAWLQMLVRGESARLSTNGNLTVAHVEGTEGCPAIVDKLLATRQLSHSPVTLAAIDIAAGAARYAALCAGETAPVVIGTAGVQKLEFASVAPHAVGVCGQTPQGDTIWCPLFEAGARLGGEIRSIHFAGDDAIPSRLILAEYTDQERCPGAWGTDPEKLRWYAEVPVDVPHIATEGRVDITIQSSTDSWNYGWSDPFIRSTFIALAN